MEVSVHLRYLFQDKSIRGKELLKLYPKLSKATIYWHAKKPLADKTVDKRKHNHGRPRKISPQDKCLILRQIHILREQYGSFIIKRLGVSAGVRKDVSDETVRCVLRGAGYWFLHSRKKDCMFLSCHVRISEWIYTIVAWMSRNSLFETGVKSEV